MSEEEFKRKVEQVHKELGLHMRTLRGDDFVALPDGKFKGSIDPFTELVYYKSGKKKGQLKYTLAPFERLEVKRKYREKFANKIADKLGLPKDFDRRYRDKYGNDTLNELSTWIEHDLGKGISTKTIK